MERKAACVEKYFGEGEVLEGDKFNEADTDLAYHKTLEFLSAMRKKF